MRNRLGRITAFAADVYWEMVRDRGTLFAAAISFYGIISLIPLLLLSVGVIGYIVGSYETALHRVLSLASQYIPSDPVALEAHLQVLSRQSGLLSGLGLLGLLWSGLQVFIILQQVMSIALGTRKNIGYIKTRVIALIMALSAGALLFISVGVTSLLTALRAYRFWGFNPDALGAFWNVLAILGPFMVSALAFILMYRFLPHTDIGTSGSLIGGTLAGVLFEAGKYAFRWYVTRFAGLSQIYGPLAGLAVLVFWIHYMSTITVVCAEITSVYAKWKGRASTE